VYLADRIVILGAHPGRVKEIVEVTLPRLRDRSSTEYFDLYRELDAILRKEMANSQAELTEA